MKRFVKSAGLAAALAMAVLLPACSQQQTAEPNNTVVLEASVTPSATATPTAKPTEKPTATPTATPTASPTASPTATPTVKPSATAKPTATARPTAKPTAKPTEAPTAQPSASTAPTATPGFSGDGYPDAQTEEQLAVFVKAGQIQSQIDAKNGEYVNLRRECAPDSAEYQAYTDKINYNDDRYYEIEELYDEAARTTDSARLSRIMRDLQAIEGNLQ